MKAINVKPIEAVVTPRNIFVHREALAICRSFLQLDLLISSKMRPDTITSIKKIMNPMNKPICNLMTLVTAPDTTSSITIVIFDYVFLCNKNIAVLYIQQYFDRINIQFLVTM